MFFRYNETFDTDWCTIPVPQVPGLLAPFPAPADWTQAAYQDVRRFQKLWDVRGTELLRSVVKLTGRKWPRLEETFQLYLCPNITKAAAMYAFPFWPFLKGPVDQLFNHPTYR